MSKSSPILRRLEPAETATPDGERASTTTGKTQVIYLASVERTQVFGSVLPAPAQAAPPAVETVTQFLPVEQLLSRAIVAQPPRASEPLPKAGEPPLPADPSDGARAEGAPRLLQTIARRFGQLSGVSRASLVLAVLFAGVLGLGRLSRARPVHGPAAARPPASAPATESAPRRLPSSEPDPRAKAPAPAELPAGLERRAADALAESRDEAALGLYRELAARDPGRAPFGEAVRILERRARAVRE